MLEDEKILVVFKVPHSSQNNLQQQKNISPVEHPKHSGGREFQSVVVSLHTTCTDLLAKVAGMNLYTVEPCYNPSNRTFSHCISQKYIEVKKSVSYIVFFFCISLSQIIAKPIYYA